MINRSLSYTISRGKILGMGTIPIPSIDTFDTCKLGVGNPNPHPYPNHNHNYNHTCNHNPNPNPNQVSLVFDTEPVLFMVSVYT